MAGAYLTVVKETCRALVHRTALGMQLSTPNRWGCEGNKGGWRLCEHTWCPASQHGSE